MKSKVKKEGSEVSGKIGQLKMKALDGKMRLTDVASTEQLLDSYSRYHHQRQNHLNFG
ncbi:MAG: hypothetical protein Q9M40_08530 [Sulfurimonas sp.]|nr:hypothetical protein [Sulfurimonas sp.]